ncbi:hypothetical protein [Alistipes sp.]|uniref:hypothetical protein n=1 Tax=Alistipes sp. TaxID=1872444 RepID=UPI003AEF48DF
MKRKLFAVLFLPLLVSACSGVLHGSGARRGSEYFAGHMLKNVTRLTDTTGREIILVPMIHIASEEQYARVRDYLDRLKADGFVTFFESLFAAPFPIDTLGELSYAEVIALKERTLLTGEDSLRVDMLWRKCRRILGTDIRSDFRNKREQRGGVIQSAELLGLTTERDIWVDYPLQDLVRLYEKRYGPVPLTAPDFAIALDDPDYELPEENEKPDTYHFLQGDRNDYLLRRLMRSSHPKIAVVYGAAHTHRLKIDLSSSHGFTVDRKYRAGTAGSGSDSGKK